MLYTIYSPGSELINLHVFGREIIIHWYGLIYCLAYLGGFAAAYQLIKQYYLPQYNYTKQQTGKLISNIFDWTLVAFLGGIIGARIWFVILQWEYFSVNLLEIPQIWLGGQSIQGGILGGILSGYIYYFFNKTKLIPFRQILDYAAIGLPIGQAIGRFGNYFNTEAFGQPSSLPWALFVPAHLRPANYLEYSTFHPTFFYEALFLIITIIILLALYPKLKNKLATSSFFIIYLILYSIGRFFLEYLRLDSLSIAGMPAAQLICIFTIIVCSLLLYILNGSDRLK